MSNDGREELHACAIEGVWWEPAGRPLIPADWIRELVVNGEIPGSGIPVHAKGVRIRGVTLQGRLDFESAHLRVPLMLDCVETNEQIVFEQATGSWISVTKSRIAGISAFELRLDHTLDLGGTESSGPVNLDGARIGGSIMLVDGFSVRGEVGLWGASIGGQLSCRNGTFSNPGGNALRADALEAGRGVFLIDGFVAHGDVRLLGASISGQLRCAGGTFSNASGSALSADAIRVSGDIVLSDGFSAEGEVRLLGASVGGQVYCGGGSFENAAGVALALDHADVRGSVLFDQGFGAKGEVRLVGTVIGGHLSCAGGRFENEGGAALNADSARVAGDIFMGDGFSALGAVILSGANVDGVLSCIGGTFVNRGGCALTVDRANVRGDVALESRRESEGDGAVVGRFTAEGEVRLMGAVIRGALSCRGGTFNNEGGYALNADGVRISRGMFLGRGFTAHGEVRLLGASIGGQLTCKGGTFSNEGGFALNADGATVGRDVFLTGDFHAVGKVRLAGMSVGGQLSCVDGSFSAPDEVGLSLQEATVAGAFLWQPKELDPLTRVDLTAASVGLIDDDIYQWPSEGLLYLHRFTYTGFAPRHSAGIQARIDWIRRSEGFHSQPYEQLASVYRAIGENANARIVGICKEKDRNGTLEAWPARWHKVWGTFTDYGYRPAKSLVIFGAFLVVAALFFWWAGSSGVMEPTNLESVATATSCSTAYPCFQPLIYAADVLIPIVDLDQRDVWTVDAAIGGADVTFWPWAVGGMTVRFVTVLLIAVGWTLTAAFIASAGRMISRR
ncbi:MAG: hypothetical protein IIC71_14820 [Acidobacteria bacterium]|nr:hypothetical protein [Acidobacteriota bacterium]